MHGAAYSRVVAQEASPSSFAELEIRMEPFGEFAPAGSVPMIKATRLVNSELHKLRAENAQAATSVDTAITRIPVAGGEPIRLDVPGAPATRQYRAVIPSAPDAPVVLWRPLEAADGAGEGVLVTTLIGRDQYDDYRRAEQFGVLDNPAVKVAAAESGSVVAGTVSSVVNADPGLSPD
jgi:hypothetical protein